MTLEHNTLKTEKNIILNKNKDTLRSVCYLDFVVLPLNFRSFHCNFHTDLSLVRIVK